MGGGGGWGGWGGGGGGDLSVKTEARRLHRRNTDREKEDRTTGGGEKDLGSLEKIKNGPTGALNIPHNQGRKNNVVKGKEGSHNNSNHGKIKIRSRSNAITCTTSFDIEGVSRYERPKTGAN